VPHFEGLPSAEAAEEVEVLDFVVVGSLREPLIELNELGGLSIDVVAESVFADGVVFLGEFLLNLFAGGVLDDVQLVMVLLIGGQALPTLEILGGHQVQELLQVGLVLEGP
jgi:hypothetical protein